MARKNYSNILKKKGWNDDEIKEAVSILDNVTKQEVFMSKFVFYTALLLIIFVNVLMSLALMFLSVVLDTTILYLIVILLAAMTGFLYNFLITDIGHLEKKHHILAMIVVPSVALFNLVLIILISNTLIRTMGLISPHNPWIIGVLFAVVFLIPSFIDKLILNKKENQSFF